jgi:hypothetical protein
MIYFGQDEKPTVQSLKVIITYETESRSLYPAKWVRDEASSLKIENVLICLVIRAILIL